VKLVTSRIGYLYTTGDARYLKVGYLYTAGETGYLKVRLSLYCKQSSVPQGKVNSMLQVKLVT
jgi:hypothetical protein